MSGNRVAVLGGLAAALALGAAPARAADADVVVRQPAYVDPAGAARPWRLIDGKWGFLAPLMEAAATRLEGCRGAEPSDVAALRLSPHRFTSTTTGALAALRRCEPALFPRRALAGTVTERTWKRLLPAEPPPSVLERSKAIAFGAAGFTGDYDLSVWDWDKSAGQAALPDAIFTWGPYRATAGYGCTVQRALAHLAADPAAGPVLREGFAEEAAVLGALLDRQPGWCGRAAAILTPVFDDPERREAFRVMFARLGSRPEIRAGYDRYFLGREGYLAGRIARYYALYDQAGLGPTEADFAFFLDRSLDYPPLTDAQIATLSGRIRTERMKGWQARRLIALETPFSSPEARSFQIGRDAAHYIDAMGQAGLSEPERTAWLRNSLLKASDVGIAERPWRPGCEVVFLPACAAASGRGAP